MQRSPRLREFASAETIAARVRNWTRHLALCGVASLTLLSASGATVVHPTCTPSRHATTVSAEAVADFFDVEAQVAGRGPFRFLSDSGSSVSLVSPALARQLGEAGRAEGNTLVGDEPQLIGRFDADVRSAPHRFERLRVEMADGLPSLGGGVAKQFAVTFTCASARGPEADLRLPVVELVR